MYSRLLHFSLYSSIVSYLPVLSLISPCPKLINILMYLYPVQYIYVFNMQFQNGELPVSFHLWTTFLYLPLCFKHWTVQSYTSLSYLLNPSFLLYSTPPLPSLFDHPFFLTSISYHLCPPPLPFLFNALSPFNSSYFSLILSRLSL